MKVIDPGHVYDLRSLDGEQLNRLVFVKREGPSYPGNVGHYPGTTMQEVLRALIDRLPPRSPCRTPTQPHCLVYHSPSCQRPHLPQVRSRRLLRLLPLKHRP